MFQLLKRRILGLDPARSLRRVAEYDLDRGYDDYAAACRQAGPAPDEPANEAELRTTAEMQMQGVSCLDVLSPAATEALRRRVVDLPVVPPRTEEIDYSDTFDVPEALVGDLVEACLPAAVAGAVGRHFGSHFFVYGCHMTRLRPGMPSKRSMLWHCDSGPTRHLKLLVYFEDSRVTGGNTAFLDRQSSDGFLEQGYTFGPVSSRRDDLGTLARRLGLRFAPQNWDVKAGQGLLFEPARVLHRGVVPDRAPRHVFTLVLLPSPRPWTEIHAARGRRVPVFKGQFPKSAKELPAGT
ncbi:hypothetical protein [Desertibaculum subflavum]|uniref:hypothetical protein n=1 Tax=Desertibaculum subflavum TaxID=2268458 RepID=UPI000E673BFD